MMRLMMNRKVATYKERPKMKYNIALIPINDRDQFINHADNLSQTAPGDRYHIGGETSIPHVSLCHFECDPDNIDNVWEQVQKLDIPSLHLTFAENRSRTYPNNPKDAGVSWVSLMPDNLDKLKELHLQVADIIKRPLNGAFDNYDPHMTLFNSKSDDACLEFNRNPRLIMPLEDDFTVALGIIDDVGQINEIIYSNESLSHTYRP